jgi:hypothetical protein
MRPPTQSKEPCNAFSTLGTDAVGSSPEQTAKVFETDLVRYARLVKQSGAKLE